MYSILTTKRVGAFVNRDLDASLLGTSDGNERSFLTGFRAGVNPRCLKMPLIFFSFFFVTPVLLRVAVDLLFARYFSPESSLPRDFEKSLKTGALETFALLAGKQAVESIAPLVIYIMYDYSIKKAKEREAHYLKHNRDDFSEILGEVKERYNKNIFEKTRINLIKLFGVFFIFTFNFFVDPLLSRLFLKENLLGGDSSAKEILKDEEVFFGKLNKVVAFFLITLSQIIAVLFILRRQDMVHSLKYFSHFGLKNLKGTMNLEEFFKVYNCNYSNIPGQNDSDWQHELKRTFLLTDGSEFAACDSHKSSDGRSLACLADDNNEEKVLGRILAGKINDYTPVQKRKALTEVFHQAGRFRTITGKLAEIVKNIYCYVSAFPSHESYYRAEGLSYFDISQSKVKFFYKSIISSSSDERHIPEKNLDIFLVGNISPSERTDNAAFTYEICSKESSITLGGIEIAAEKQSDEGGCCFGNQLRGLLQAFVQAQTIQHISIRMSQLGQEPGPEPEFELKEPEPEPEPEVDPESVMQIAPRVSLS